MSKLKSNFIYNAAYQVLILIIPFITTPYVSRTIGATGLGIYSYTYSIVSYFMMFALLGMNNYGNREVAKNSDDKEKLDYIFSSIYYLQLITTIVISIIYFIYIIFFNKQYINIELIQIIYMISVAFDVNWLFCGLQKFKITVTRSAILKVVTLGLILIFVKNENDLYKYVVILSVTTLLNQVILWPFLRRKVKFVKVKFKDIIKHLKPTLILFIPILATSIYRVMDKIMIGNISNVTEVGYYENAEKMLNIIMSIVAALGTVTLPQMTYLYNNNRIEEYNRILDKSIKLIFFIVLPVIAGFMVTGDSLVLIYLGDSFKKSAILLKILSISLLFSPIAGIIRMQFLIPRNKDKEYIISVILGAITNFILNYILIPLYQSVGAAIATVVAEFVVAIAQYIFIFKEISFKYVIKDVLKFLITSIIMFIIVLLLGNMIKNEWIKLMVQIVVGILIYGILNFKYITSQIDIEKILRRN